MQDDHAQLSKGGRAALKIALVLSIIGALNWGLVGLFNWNLVDAIFGGGAREMTSTASRVIYTLVGLASLVAAYFLTVINSAAREHGIPSAPPSR
jgi:uncharacterized membrane protein YuzA (DUF378 family)